MAPGDIHPEDLLAASQLDRLRTLSALLGATRTVRRAARGSGERVAHRRQRRLDPLTVSALRPPRAPFAQTSFAVTVSPTQPGEWTDRIDLTSDDAQHPTIHIGMHGAH
jgi:hypothetical protein